jgi:hypothetical protein
LPVSLFFDMERELQRFDSRNAAAVAKQVEYSACLRRFLELSPVCTDAELLDVYNRLNFTQVAAAISWAMRAALEALYGVSLCTEWLMASGDQPGKKFSRHTHAPRIVWSGVDALNCVMILTRHCCRALLGDDVMPTLDPAVYTPNRNFRLFFNRKMAELSAVPLTPCFGSRDSATEWVRATLTGKPPTDHIAMCTLDELAVRQQQCQLQVWRPCYNEPETGPWRPAFDVVSQALQLLEIRPTWLSDDQLRPLAKMFDASGTAPLQRVRALHYLTLALGYYRNAAEAPEGWVDAQLPLLSALCYESHSPGSYSMGLSLLTEALQLCCCLFRIEPRASEHSFVWLERHWNHHGLMPDEIFAMCVGPLRYHMGPESRRTELPLLEQDDLVAHTYTVEDLQRALVRLPPPPCPPRSYLPLVQPPQPTTRAVHREAGDYNCMADPAVYLPFRPKSASSVKMAGK